MRSGPVRSRPGLVHFASALFRARVCVGIASLPLEPVLCDAPSVGPFRQGKPIPLPTPELDEYEKELRKRSHRKVTYAGIACILMVMPLIVLNAPGLKVAV